MKFSLSGLLNSSPKSVYQTALRRFCGTGTGIGTVGSYESLYRRISPLGDPNVSVVPVLDQWIAEGRTVDKVFLQNVIKEFRAYRRFKHALEISMWMTDKRYIPLSPGDIAMRLNLISRVHGLEQAENYFNTIPQKLKCIDVHIALLNCYANASNIEKAESQMQKLKDLGCDKTPLRYNIMMNFYSRLKNWAKMDSVMNEMEERGVALDSYTYTIRLSAYASALDGGGIGRMLAKMESDPRINIDITSYTAAAHGYIRVGLPEKAMVVVEKVEKLVATAKKKTLAFDCLLKLYADLGNKEELHRVWHTHVRKEKFLNKNYLNMIASLLKCNDLKGAEEIFEEWDSRRLHYDFRVPNFLIKNYCENGFMEKAEALLEKGVAGGGNPTVNTWYCLAGGYIADDQIGKGVEALKKAISLCPSDWNPSKGTLEKCLEFLEKKGDVEEAEQFVKFLKEESVFSSKVHDRLSSFIENEKSG